MAFVIGSLNFFLWMGRKKNELFGIFEARDRSDRKLMVEPGSRTFPLLLILAGTLGCKHMRIGVTMRIEVVSCKGPFLNKNKLGTFFIIILGTSG